jgi:hypothetical protein
MNDPNDEELAKQLARQVAQSQMEGGTMHRPRQPKNMKAAQQEEMRRKMLDAAGKIAPPSTDDAQKQMMMQKQQKPIGYAKGGRVRGVGCARKGHGRGTMR